jgi:hypothetical protein
VLFGIAVVVFSITSWIATRYAQGYMIDVATWSFVRTGAIAISTNTSAKLFIDDVLVGQTSFLGNNAGKDRLAPGIHEVTIYKEGWSSWHKAVNVEAGRLTDFPSVLLLPLSEGFQGEARSESEQAFALARVASRSPITLEFSGDQYVTLAKGKLFDAPIASGSLLADHVLGIARGGSDRLLWWTNNEIWILWRSATNYQPLRVQGERSLIARFRTPIIRAGWYDAEHVVVDMGSAGMLIFETDMRGGQNVIRI